MSKREYSIREKEIISKLNKVNSALAGKKIKINYSVYNSSGIASKLEKSDLYSLDVSNAVFLRSHTYDSKYNVDSVVCSYGLKNETEIEETFNAKISDIEKANVSDLIEYFGNLDNHELRGFGKDKEYQITYKGIDGQGQDVEIQAWYGIKNKYKVRKSLTKINNDGTIQKVFSDKAINFDESDLNIFDKVFAQGIEEKNPDSYSLVENETDNKGNNKFKISCVGKDNVNYQVIAKDDKFNDIDVVNYIGKTCNYYEYKGKVEKASGKLSCRIDIEKGKLVKPNFSKAKNIVEANKVCDSYYKSYKNFPKVRIDEKKNKIIIEGRNTELYKLNFNNVEDAVKNTFENYLKKGYVIETVYLKPEKKYIRKK